MMCSPQSCARPSGLMIKYGHSGNCWPAELNGVFVTMLENYRTVVVTGIKTRNDPFAFDLSQRAALML